MLYPTLNEVTELLNEYKRTPVFCEVLSDTCTPIHIYNALESKEENCFMLESVDNSQQWGRYSFIGIHPKAEIKVKNGTITHTVRALRRCIWKIPFLIYLISWRSIVPPTFQTNPN